MMFFRHSVKSRLGKCAGRPGFSLIEMLVTVALLSVIMIGLVVMFNQTRRAFTSSFTQVDVLQAGRSAADLISRQVEQMASANSLSITNFYVDSPYNSFLVQSNNGDFTTNLIQDFFCITRNNQTFNGIGYRVIGANAANGIGSLCQYSVTAYATNLSAITNPIPYFRNLTAVNTNFIRLIDGVVDFRIRAYDVNGVAYTNLYSSANAFLPYVNTAGNGSFYVQTNVLTGDLALAAFAGAALPAYVEIELGILEDKALTQYNVLSVSGTGSGTAAYNYLVGHPGQVHVFRQRITIRNVNPAAYP